MAEDKKLGSSRTRKLGEKNQGKTLFFQEHEGRNATAVMPAKKGKRVKGTVGDGAAGKKAKATEQVGGQCVSEKSQATRTSNNLFEKSNTKTQYFVREVKGRRMTKNGVEVLIGWRDFPLDKDDTWEPITNLPGSEHMIAEFQRHWEEFQNGF